MTGMFGRSICCSAALSNALASLTCGRRSPRRPRLLFVIGSCLRALQSSTVIQLVFDPTAGVGAGLNLLALWVSSQWPAPLVLGWAASKPFWRMLRAAPPRSDVRVPIAVGGLMG